MKTQKTCVRCNREFPTSVKVNGINRNLQNRRYCLECSPYLGHNTRKLHLYMKDYDKHKTCPRCGVLKCNDDFYLQPNGRPYSWCRSCNKIHSSKRQQIVKAEAVAVCGGRCQSCGYDTYLGALEFHHLDKKLKTYSISSARSHKIERILDEVKKCVLVCSNCHKEIEAGIRDCPMPPSATAK